MFPIPFLPRIPRRIGPLACSYPCRLRPGHIQSDDYSVFKVHCARIVRPALQKQQAKKWPLPKSKSEVSCGFAESQVFRFPSHKRRKALKTLGFPRGSKNGPSFQKFFVFSVFPSGLRIVPPITRKHYATAWHIAKLRSQDSCGFAGFTSVEFCGRNRRKQLMLQSFSNVPRNGTLRRDFFQAKNKYLSLICSEKPKCTPFFEKLFAAY